MEKQIFEKFRSIIYKESGIVLPPEKISLLSNRIQKRLKALKISGEKEYLKIIELDQSGEELANLVDVVSTNVTHFYREENHFSELRKILQTYKNKSEIKIWCAAASSGEEPYTILFEALETINSNNQNLKILATDICTKVLREALNACYKESSASKIPDQIKAKYMHRKLISGETYWEVNPDIKELILFKKLNLISIPYPLKGKIDIIFCRNVMIYFDAETRAKIVAEFWKKLNPDGYLFLSHSENLFGLEHNFSKVGASLYQRKD